VGDTPTQYGAHPYRRQSGPTILQRHVPALVSGDEIQGGVDGVKQGKHVIEAGELFGRIMAKCD
jgi:hypothetical protein